MPSSGGSGERGRIYKVKKYDHATFADMTSGTTNDYGNIGNFLKERPDTYISTMFDYSRCTPYYYKVRAVDAAGQKGTFSDEVSIRTKEQALRGTAQSIYAPEHGADNALDPAIHRAWVSKQYGGGTKAKPNDVWWAVEFLEKPVTIKGVTIIGDHRDVIPLQTALQVQVRDNGAWKTVAEVKDANDKIITVTLPKPVFVTGLRIFVPAADLPKSPQRADTDGIVRICELRVILAE